MVLCLLLTVNYLTAVQSTFAQVGSPFDLAPRLDTTEVFIPAAQLPPSRVTTQPEPLEKRNPFDLARAENQSKETVVRTTPKVNLPLIKGLGEEDKLSMSRGSFNTILGFSLLFLLALAFVWQGGPLRKMLGASMNSNMLSQIQREQRKFGYFFWATLGLVNLGSFLFVAARHLHPSMLNYSWRTLGWFVLGAIGLTALKLLALQVMKAIFPLEKPIRHYQMLILVFAGIIGLCLFPLLILVCFSAPSIASTIAYAGLGVAGLGYLIRTLRGLGDSTRYIFGFPIHFLLYLCGLEIGPLAVALKLLTS